MSTTELIIFISIGSVLILAFIATIVSDINWMFFRNH